MPSSGRKRFVVVVAALLACVVAVAPCRPAAAESAPDIVVFSREGCSRCAEAARFLATLHGEQPALRIETHDVVREPDAQARLRALLDRRRVRPLLVPCFLIGEELVVGFKPDTTPGEIRSRLAAAAGAAARPSAAPSTRPAP